MHVLSSATIIAAVVLVLAACAGAQERMLTSFEDAADIQCVQRQNARISVTTQHATNGRHALEAEFQPAEWANVVFTPEQPEDWSGFGGVGLDVTNPGSEPVELSLRVDDDASADGYHHSRTGSWAVKPGATTRLVLTLAPDPMSVGMRGLPPRPGFLNASGNGAGSFDLHHIVKYLLFTHNLPSARTLYIDNVRLVPPVSLKGIVDRYGQYTGAEWPGKVHSDADIAAQRQAEEADLRAHPTLPDRDRFGGWASGPKHPAAGFFRTVKDGGRWWLVDPDGHLFFSAGVDTVELNERTMTTGREYMFTWLPKPGDPLAAHAGRTGYLHSGPVKEGADFDFYSANLERKYGPSGSRSWLETTLERLPSWGFNTIGNWSDARFYRNGRVPYVATTGVGGDHARVSSGSDYWGSMHDPFDPRFAADADRSIQEAAALVKDDPWCVGYFVDNELSWSGNGENGRYGLALGSLALGPNAPAKQAITRELRAKYGDVGKLNAAWGTTFPSWEGLSKPSGTLTAAAKEDLSAFVRSFARQYFRVVRDALKRHDPDHLYLGCRFAWSAPEAVVAAAELCDVVSFNIYAPRVDPARWGYLAGLNRPCIIGEFHFGALDRGMFHPGLVATPDQAARSRMYEDYVRSVLDNPVFVGCHWFQYVDEPLTGRTWDGENYNIGFVNVADAPYPEMVAAARRIHSHLYSSRSAGR